MLTTQHPRLLTNYRHKISAETKILILIQVQVFAKVVSEPSFAQKFVWTKNLLVGYPMPYALCPGLSDLLFFQLLS